jgi:hypothetical protein
MASVKVLMKMNKLNEQGLAPLYLRITKTEKPNLFLWASI